MKREEKNGSEKNKEELDFFFLTKSHGGLQFYGVRSDVSIGQIRSHPPTHKTTQE